VTAVDRAAVDDAAGRVGGRVRETPTLEVDAAVLATPSPVILKLELFQHTGSFKPRGAFNRVLSHPTDLPLVAASGGNHGIAVAHVARELERRADVFVPETSDPVKVERLTELGARVHQVGTNYAQSLVATRRFLDTAEALDVHAYDQPDVVAGQGTVGRELLLQAGAVDTVVVAVGGGGLMAGVIAALDGEARVVAVEPEHCPTLHRALLAGAPVDVEVGGIAANSLGASSIGRLAFAAAQQAAVESVLVTDDDIVAAQRRLWHAVRLVAEPGGAAAAAALLSGAYRPASDERVAVIVCGANADLAAVVR